MLRSAVVSQARLWLNAPYAERQSTRFGTDCVGFCVGVARELNVGLGDVENYYSKPIGNSLIEGLIPFLDLQPDLTFKPGSILIFKIAGVPHHVAFATSESTMIHADDRSKKVVETPIGFWSRLLVAVFEFKNIEYEENR